MLWSSSWQGSRDSVALRGLLLEPSASRRGGSGRAGRPVRHLVQPGTERFGHPQGLGLLDQDRKRGLDRILHVVRIRQAGPADPPDQRQVPLEQRGERQLGDFACPGGEKLEQLAVRQPSHRPDAQHSLELPPTVRSCVVVTVSILGQTSLRADPDSHGTGIRQGCKIPDEIYRTTW
jgi:hypothetical protein